MEGDKYHILQYNFYTHNLSKFFVPDRAENGKPSKNWPQICNTSLFPHKKPSYKKVSLRFAKR